MLSLDGSHINILLNLDIFEDIYEVPEYETYPIGLFRTEFLFMNSPDVFGIGAVGNLQKYSKAVERSGNYY